MNWKWQKQEVETSHGSVAHDPSREALEERRKVMGEHE